MYRLYGYLGNVWTDEAVEALRVAGIVDFEMKPAPEGVNWDNPSAVFRRMPSLVLVRPFKNFLLASGIDEIRELLANAEEDGGLREFLLSHGFKKEDVDALWDSSAVGGDQEEQPET